MARARPGERLRLLDVGVGRGRTMRYLKALGCADSVDFFGVDISERRLRLVHGRESWRLQRVDVEVGLPFQGGSFDVVVCEQVLEHLARPAYVLGEIWRVARPGALIIVGVPSFPRGVAEIRRHVVPWFDRLKGRSRSHVQVFSVRSFLRLLKTSGDYDVQSVRGFRFVSGGPLRFLEEYYWWYLMNHWAGKRAPGWATEIQVALYRGDGRGAKAGVIGDGRAGRDVGDGGLAGKSRGTAA